jgi:chitinase
MTGSPTILAYFAAWSIYGRSYFVSDIPGDRITDINYALANIGSDGRIAIGDPWGDTEKTFSGDTWDQPLRGNFNQLIKLKEKYPHLRPHISVGGWVIIFSFILCFIQQSVCIFLLQTWSGKFSDIALSDESLSKFAVSRVEFIQKYAFDGIDLDW